jgi:hypothetical protein
MEKIQYKEKKTIRMDRELWEKILEVSKEMEYRNQNDLFKQIMWAGVKSLSVRTTFFKELKRMLKEFWKTI